MFGCKLSLQSQSDPTLHHTCVWGQETTHDRGTPPAGHGPCSSTQVKFLHLKRHSKCIFPSGSPGNGNLPPFAGLGPRLSCPKGCPQGHTGSHHQHDAHTTQGLHCPPWGVHGRVPWVQPVVPPHLSQENGENQDICRAKEQLTKSQAGCRKFSAKRNISLSN